MNIVGIALGETYSAFLNVKGEIYVIGKIAPIRENLSNDMEYIKPIKCDPISKNRKAWIVKIRSGRKHLVCVDRDYKLYSFGMNHDGCLGSEEYNALANPKHIPELNTND
jgi:alpha-tubulin suppressor-like RCC1 family protein